MKGAGGPWPAVPQRGPSVDLVALLPLARAATCSRRNGSAPEPDLLTQQLRLERCRLRRLLWRKARRESCARQQGAPRFDRAPFALEKLIDSYMRARGCDRVTALYCLGLTHLLAPQP